MADHCHMDGELLFSVIESYGLELLLVWWADNQPYQSPIWQSFAPDQGGSCQQDGHDPSGYFKSSTMNVLSVG